MTTDRIKEIQEKTAHPNSVSVQQALLQVWNECEQDNKDKKYTKEDIEKAIEIGIEYGHQKGYQSYYYIDEIINSLNKQG